MQNQSANNSRNRGKSSGDEKFFASAKERYKLQHALEDMYYLLSRGYPVKSSLALAGNRYRLTARQLLALQGMSCSAEEIKLRAEKELTVADVKGKTIYLDGFNILILLETLLSGGYVFKGLDACYRDISSVHGTYKKVNQTEDVFKLVGQAFNELEAEKVIWIFDKPVSNSGRLKIRCYEIAEKYGFKWDIYLDNSPDKYLIEEKRFICSSDAWVLNNCHAWFNLGACIINALYPDAKPDNVVEFSSNSFYTCISKTDK